MDKKIVLQDGVTFSYDNDGVVRDMSILDGVEEKEQTTVQSYILEQMNSKGIAKENLYL